MADQPITGLPTKTTSGVAATDKMLGIDSAEGYQILVGDVAKYIVENYAGSTLAGSARTPKAAIDALNNVIGDNTSHIGNIRYYYANIGTGYSTLLARVQATIDRSDFPTNYMICGAILSGSYHSLSGFLDANKNGFIAFGNYSSGQLFSVEGGTAKVVSATKDEVDALNNNTIKSSGSNHTAMIYFDSDYSLLRMTDENGNYTNLVFYDTGKVEITRYAYGSWKPGAILRNADS